MLIIAYAFKRGYVKGVGSAEQVEVVRAATAVLAEAALLQEHIYTLNRFDLLFSSDLVLYLLTQVSKQDYDEFISDALTSLRRLEGSLPDNVKLVVLRAIKVDSNDNSKQFMFEPVFNNYSNRTGGNNLTPTEE